MRIRNVVVPRMRCHILNKIIFPLQTSDSFKLERGKRKKEATICHNFANSIIVGQTYV
jgi:hypothetical protein